METMDRYAPLCNEIRKKFRTMRAFSAALNMHPSTLSAKVNGGSQWTFDEVARACQILGIPLAEASLYFPPRV